VSTIDYYVWLLSDWAYLGGVRFVQLAARHGLKINHIPLRMQDVYAGSGGVLLANRSWQRQVPDHRTEAMALPARHSREHRA
jgi:2-hydroxychromene-2-carboxylate isomerase